MCVCVCVCVCERERERERERETTHFRTYACTLACSHTKRRTSKRTCLCVCAHTLTNTQSHKHVRARTTCLYLRSVSLSLDLPHSLFPSPYLFPCLALSQSFSPPPCTRNARAPPRAKTGRAGLDVAAAAAAGLRGGCSECRGLRLVAAAQLGGALRRRRWLTRMCIGMGEE